jgi:predicted Zn-dependent protease
MKKEKIVSDINSEDEKLIEQAMELRQKEQRLEAINILIPLVQKYPNDSVLNGILGMIYSEIENFEVSAAYFRKTTILNPHSELAALGLFHCYWDLGKYKAAYKEMDKFLSNNKKAKLFKITLKEQYEQLNPKSPKYQREIIDKHIKLIMPRKK